MDRKNDLVLAAFDNHTWEDIEPWVISLERSGYEGRKAVIVYNVKREVLDKLASHDVMVYSFGGRDDAGNSVFPKLNNVVVDRFFHASVLIKALLADVRLVVMTDIRDVIFQDNISDLLDDIWHHEITDYGIRLFVQGEGLTYEEEPWSKNNMLQSLGPWEYECVRDQEILCAGVIVGEPKLLADLCMHVATLCRVGPMHVPGGGGPDQAALNFILRSEAYSQFLGSSWRDWCIHAGTSQPAVKAGSGTIGREYKEYRLSDKILDKLPNPKMVDDVVCVNGNGRLPYYIVHQYNRVPEWDQVIREKYRE